MSTKHGHILEQANAAVVQGDHETLQELLHITRRVLGDFDSALRELGH
ncbi:MAG: hypothetical protein I8H71_08395 [Xanthomonadaceae bacterium]|nr:hypothetical protein [Xanthomonadaceae bacterium]